jgi:hypothetical protein
VSAVSAQAHFAFLYLIVENIWTDGGKMGGGRASGGDEGNYTRSTGFGIRQVLVERMGAAIPHTR